MSGGAGDRELLQLMPDAVIVTGAGGEIVFANRKARAMTGYARRELLGRKIEILVPAGVRTLHSRLRRQFYERGAVRLMGSPHADVTLRRKDGSAVPVEIALGPAGEDTVAVIRDTTERRRMEAELEHRALHDPLTDLANRTLFFDRLRQSLHAARREHQLVAVVMVDLDGFKAINDAHGHSTGDVLLRHVAQRLSDGLRSTDTAARIGGDEFALILPLVSSRSVVERMVRQRLAAAREPWLRKRKRIEVGASAGIAIYPDDGRDPDTLLRNADAAMYAAKRAGRELTFHAAGPKT